MVSIMVTPRLSFLTYAMILADSDCPQPSGLSLGIKWYHDDPDGLWIRGHTLSDGWVRRRCGECPKE